MVDETMNHIEIDEIKFELLNDGENNAIFDGFFRNKQKIKVRKVEIEKTFENEVETYKKLKSHLNVQRLFAHELHNSIHYFGLQSYDITLKDFINLPEKEQNSKRIHRLLIIENLVNGLKALHDQNFVHKNISISNIGIIYEEKKAILCNCGFDDLQEDIFTSPEESQGEGPSKQSDIFSLGCIIYFILSNGCHPFGSLDNPQAIIKNTKLTEIDNNKFSSDLTSFENSTKSVYKVDCAKSLLMDILMKDPKKRPDCSGILDYPFFLDNHKIYNYLNETNCKWESLTSNVLEMFPVYPWTDKLKKVTEYSKYSANEDSSLVVLVKYITSKVRHYEDELYNEIHFPEHLMYYLNLFPDLLSYIFNIQKNIDRRQKNVKILPSASGIQEEQINQLAKSYDLLGYFKKEGLHIKVILENEVKIGDKLSNANPSNSVVYNATYANQNVIIKKIKKENFVVFTDEVKSFYQLINRTEKDPNEKTNKNSGMCAGCHRKVCVNVIGFYGCFAEEHFYCLVLEKAEMSFREYITKVRKDDLNGSCRRITKIFEDAVKGLHCLHKNFISHLDIKPENILIVKRAGNEIGCLADFGISIRALRKTLTNLNGPGTDGYRHPMLSKATEEELDNKKIDYYKCDIYSLGMVLIKDCIGIIIRQNTTTSASLGKSRLNNDISSICEQLVMYMIKEDPDDQPDTECLLKNPFLWKEANDYFDFLKKVNDYQNKTHLETSRRKAIEDNAVAKLFTSKDKTKNDWLCRLENPDISEEIETYLGNNLKKENSVFDLVELIIKIPENKKDFPLTNEILKSSEPKLYISFWLAKYDLITFLYYVMQDDMKGTCKSLYSQGCGSYVLRRRSLLKDQPSKQKGKSSLTENTDGIFPTQKMFKIGYKIQEDRQFLDDIKNDQPFILP